ncbi:MAG TPA: threonine/serine dehydratase [Terriglobales bacterium]|jgi:threonine dehydratase|nr:threonine/serine dehydratase [Terriglobales bacterium]
MVTLNDIKEAQARIRGVATRTPLLPYPASLSGDPVFLKLESLQPMGAFKLRGAYNKIVSLSEKERQRGVITYSSGNHAQAVAYAARALGIRAVVVMPSNAPQIKQESTKAMRAEVVLVGPASAERQVRAEELAQRYGYVMVPPYNDEKIIAGQGTLALEILEDLPQVELVLSPVSGGGLLSGIATAIKLSRPETKVVGVEPELAADAQESLRSGRLVEWPAEKTTRTICDGLRTQSLGAIPYEHVRRYVDDIVTVSEDEIREAVRRLALYARVVAEPSGAASFAAFLFHRTALPKSKCTVAVISGGNADPALLAEIVGSKAV